METKKKYTVESKVVPFGRGTIVIENHTPILTEKERGKRKKEIESCLYHVFNKYDKNGANPVN